MSTVVFFVVPQVHLLDLAGPAQAFSMADGLDLAYRLRYVADGPSVTSAQGLPLQTETRWPRLSRDDLVVVAGWQGKTLSGGPISRSALDALAAHHAAGGTVASVCAGAPRRSVERACWTAGAVPPTTRTRTNWPGATPPRTWCATCCSPRTTEW